MQPGPASGAQLTSSEITWVAFAAFIGFTICWVAMFVSLRKEPKMLRLLVSDGILLRVVTVVFVLFSVCVLAITEKLTPDVTAIMAGIAGYVLGGVGRAQKADESQEPPKADPTK